MRLEIIIGSIHLTKQQKNLIYEAIAEAGLDATQCDLSITGSGFRIEHDAGSSLNAVLIDSGLRHFLASEFKFGSQRYNLSALISGGSLWYREVKADLTKILPVIRQWASDVKEVVETPDLWAEAQRNREILADIHKGKSENTPFTQDERKQIAAQLQAAKEQLKERSDLTSEQIAHIGERLDEATEATGRMGRKDWLLLFGGTILNLIVTDTVTPTVAQHIFTMTIHGLIQLFTGGTVPPQIPPPTIV